MMTKIRKLIAMLLIMVFAGLSVYSVPVEAKELTPAQIVKKAAATSSKVKNYTAKTELNFAVKYNGKTNSMKVTQQTSCIRNPFKMKCEVTLTQQGKKQKQTIYYVKKGKTLYSYTKESNTWVKSTISKEEANQLIKSNPSDVMKECTKYMKNPKLKNKNAKVSGRSAYVITANMPVSELIQTSEGQSLDLSKLKGKKIPVTIWIDKKDYYPLKYKIDVKSLFQGDLSGDNEMEITKCSAVVTYSKINKTSSIKLPSGVK